MEFDLVGQHIFLKQEPGFRIQENASQGIALCKQWGRVQEKYQEDKKKNSSHTESYFVKIKEKFLSYLSEVPGDY